MAGKFKVIFDGFETLEQAQAFVDWCTNNTEFALCLYKKELDDITFVSANHKFVDEEDREIIVPLNLYKK
jgi:hypothetical protein